MIKLSADRSRTLVHFKLISSSFLADKTFVLLCSAIPAKPICITASSICLRGKGCVCVRGIKIEIELKTMREKEREREIER